MCVLSGCQSTKQLLNGVQEPDTMILSNMLETIDSIVETAGSSLLSMDQLAQAFERFGKVLEESHSRRLERDSRRHAEDFDQEEAEALQVWCLSAESGLEI